jgi:hypothetical protein
MAPGGWPNVGGINKRGINVLTAQESLGLTDYCPDQSPEGLEQWRDLLQEAVRDGVARRVTYLTYELGPAFWEYAEKAIHPQGGDGGGGGVEGGRDMGTRGGGFEVRVAQGGGGGFEVRVAQGGGGIGDGGFGVRGAQGGGGIGDGGGFGVRGAQGGGGGIGGGGGFAQGGGGIGGGGGGGFRSRGPTRTMTAVGSLKATDYWDDRSPEGLAQWKALLQDAVRKGLARQVVSNFTYELGPEFWEAAEKAIHPGGRTRS